MQAYTMLECTMLEAVQTVVSMEPLSWVYGNSIAGASTTKHQGAQSHNSWNAYAPAPVILDVQHSAQQPSGINNFHTQAL